MTSTEGASAQEGASPQVREAVTTIQEKAETTTLALKDQASDRMRSEIDSRSSQVSEQLTPIAEALRKGAEQLNSEGNGSSAQLAARAAEQTDRLAGYLRRVDGESLVGDLEDVARSRPWLVASAGVVAGFVSSRFLKASSARRAERRTVRTVGGSPAAAAGHDLVRSS